MMTRHNTVDSTFSHMTVLHCLDCSPLYRDLKIVVANKVTDERIQMDSPRA